MTSVITEHAVDRYIERVDTTASRAQAREALEVATRGIRLPSGHRVAVIVKTVLPHAEARTPVLSATSPPPEIDWFAAIGDT